MVLGNGGQVTQNVHQEKKKIIWEGHPTQNNIINLINILGNGGQVTQNVRQKRKNKWKWEEHRTENIIIITTSKHLFKFFKY